MRLYVFLAMAAYLGFAINAVIDKFLLHKAIREPAVYAFYIGILNAAAIVLVPFGFALPAGAIILAAVISGVAFVYGLVAFFRSLQFEDASRVLPAIGGMTPVISLALNYFLLGERLAGWEIGGLILLVTGTFLIGIGSNSHQGTRWVRSAAIAAVLFSISFSAAKIVYDDQPSFISGLIWTRLGAVIGACTLLLVPRTRRAIFHLTRSVESASGWLFLFGQAIAASASILQNYAVKLGSVTVVNALQGTQFAFLFVLTGLVSRYYPKVLKEDFSTIALLRKISAIILISTGLALVI